MPDRSAISTPVRFMGRFLLAAVLLLLAWTYLADYYAATLLIPVNWIFAIQGMPVELAQRGGTLVLGIPGGGGQLRYFQLQGHDLTYLNLPAAMALLVAMPGWSLRGRLNWCAATSALLWVTHVLGLYGGGYSAIGAYVGSQSPEIRGRLVDSLGEAFSTGLADSLGYSVGWWSIWGGPVLILLLWVLAAPSPQLWRGAHGERA